MWETNEDDLPRARKGLRLVRAWRALMQLTEGVQLADATNVVADVRNIAVSEHDVILIEVPGAISPDSAERLREHIKRLWPRHEVLVLGEEMKLRIIQRDKINAVASRLVKSA